MANYNDRGGRRSDDYKRPNRKNSDGFRYSDDRKPRFNDDRKPRFDSDRKPFESDFFEDEVLDVEFNAFPSRATG